MKNHAKVGNKKGQPAYRTPATFRYRKQMAAQMKKASFPKRTWKPSV